MLKDSISKIEKANFECKSCVLLKITKQPFKEQLETVSKPFERLHLDLFGPINPESSLKNQFILTVVDNYSGYLAGFPITQKDETTDVLINLIKTEHSRQGYYPMIICSDGGGEFLRQRLAQFFNKKHIQKLLLEPSHPEHNGGLNRQTVL